MFIVWAGFRSSIDWKKLENEVDLKMEVIGIGIYFMRIYIYVRI